MFAQMMPRDMLPFNDPRQITGCVLSSLLSTRFDHLKPTLGLVDGPTCMEHYAKLTELGYQAAQLHCEGYIVEEAAIRNFRERFSGAPMRAPKAQGTK